MKLVQAHFSARKERESSFDHCVTRLNHQLNQYLSWKPDPFAMATDAFCISWKDSRCCEARSGLFKYLQGRRKQF